MLCSLVYPNLYETISLKGSEVKAIREDKANIKEAYSMGPNISAKVIKPFGMSLGANELKVAALLEISNHAASL